MTRTGFSISFFVLAVASFVDLGCQKPTEDKILHNGKIYTLDPSNPTAEAVAIRNGKIVAVGDLTFVESQTTNPSYIDLDGQCLLPGLIDSHNHAIKGGERLLTAHLSDKILSKLEFTAFATDALETGKGKRGDGLYITGVHSGMWTNIEMLNSIFNKLPFDNVPVLLLGTDGHTSWSNNELLHRAGVTKEFLGTLSHAEKKFYGTTNSGEPNGFITEEAIQKVNRTLPPGSVTAYDGARSGMQHLNSLGITAWLDPSTGDIKEGIDNEKLAAYAALAQQEELTAHVVATIVADANGDVGRQIETIGVLQKKFGNTAHLSIVGFKIFADGVMEYPTQTAAMSIPYKNSGSMGSLMVEPERFKRFVTRADKEGLLVHVHAIGDRAVTEALNAFEAARDQNQNKLIPHSITHLQIVRPDDFERFASLNILPCMQLLWATADQYTEELVKPYVDSTLYSFHYPAHSLINAGAILCGASDWPVSSANPFKAIAIAETRKGDLGILNEDEAVSREVMIQAYTINAAKTLLLEKKIGSIQTGKQADFVLVDRDVMSVDSDSIANTKVIWTMFGGEKVYETP